MQEGKHLAWIWTTMQHTIFHFLISQYTYFNTSWISYRLRQDLLAGPNISENAIAGISNHLSTGYSSFTNYYPYALNNGALIGDSLQWQATWGLQILALRTYHDTGAIHDICDFCYWYNVDVSETIDRYLGVRFLDDAGHNHYGWIRCDVKDEGRTLVIKDYAYEVQPGYPIVAGSTEHYVDINNLPNTLDANAYSYGKNIYIYLNAVNAAQLLITDIAGKEILKKELQNKNEIINMNMYAAGIYIIKLNSGENIYTKKIRID